MKATLPTPGRAGPQPAATSPLEFGALFDRHAGAVYRLCARRTGDLDLAHDLTSVTFREAWRRRDSVPADADPTAWLMGIAINVSRNAMRSRRRYAAALARLPSPPAQPDHADRVVEQAAAQAELHRAVSAIAALTPDERDVLTLICWQELTYE